jgi:hypothetical protein
MSGKRPVMPRAQRLRNCQIGTAKKIAGPTLSGSSHVGSGGGLVDDLPLFLALHVFLDFDEGFAVVIRAGIHGVEGIGKEKLVLLCFLGIRIGRVFQSAQPRLKFGVGLDDSFHRPADIVPPADVHINVVIQLLVYGQEILQ